MRYRPVLKRSEAGLIEHLVPVGLDDPSRVLGMVPATPAEIEDDE